MSDGNKAFMPTDLAALSLAAVKARYRLAKPSGLLFLAGAVLDPFIYAAVVYFVLDGVFGLRGIDRYMFLLIGFVSFRWTLGCILDGVNFAPLSDRLAEAGRNHRVTALLVVVAPPTLVTILSLSAALCLSVAVGAPEQKLEQLKWIIPILAVQGVWNAAIVLAYGRLRARHRGAGPFPLAVVAGLLWFLSPVMYKFGDIPAEASELFTTFNPVSHLLAAYHNAIWYGQPISLDVLPAAGLVGLALVFWLGRGAVSAALDEAPHEGQPGLPHLRVAWGEHGPAEGPAFRPWTDPVKGLTGQEMVGLIVRTWRRPRADGDAVEKIRRTAALGRLFDDRIAIYPDWTLAQLALAVALESPRAALVLDGLLDPTDMVFRRDAWARLEREAREGRSVTVVTYRLLTLPDGAQGTFTSSDGRSGQVGAALAAYYAERLEREPPRDGARA